MKLKLAPAIRAIPGQFAYVTQVFGTNGEWYRENGINILGHNGIDILARNGQEVYAAHAGIVTALETDPGGGVGLVLRTAEKYDYESDQVFYKTIYWHLEKYAVKQGDNVKAGDLIAFADNTGFSTGSHLHFGLKPVKDDGTNLLQDNGYFGAIDPLPFMYQETMEHIIIGDNQYLLYTPLKIAISIADPGELEKLRERGLTSQPAPAPSSALNGYWVIPGVEEPRIAELFNL